MVLILVCPAAGRRGRGLCPTWAAPECPCRFGARLVDDEAAANEGTASPRLEARAQTSHTHRRDRVDHHPGGDPRVHQRRHRHVSGDARYRVEVKVQPLQGFHSLFTFFHEGSFPEPEYRRGPAMTPPVGG